MFGHNQIIGTSGTRRSLADVISVDVPFCQHIAQVSILALTVPDVKIFVYVKSSVPSVTTPPLKLIQLFVVNPVGIHTKLLARVQRNFTVVVGVIFKLAQDCMFLAKLGGLVFVYHTQLD